MSVDRELVTRKLLLITGDLEALGEVGASGLAGYLESRTQQAVAERYLERMIGRMISTSTTI